MTYPGQFGTNQLNMETRSTHESGGHSSVENNYTPDNMTTLSTSNAPVLSEPDMDGFRSSTSKTKTSSKEHNYEQQDDDKPLKGNFESQCQQIDADLSGYILTIKQKFEAKERERAMGMIDHDAEEEPFISEFPPEIQEILDEVDSHINKKSGNCNDSNLGPHTGCSGGNCHSSPPQTATLNPNARNGTSYVMVNNSHINSGHHDACNRSSYDSAIYSQHTGATNSSFQDVQKLKKFATSYATTNCSYPNIERPTGFDDGTFPDNNTRYLKSVEYDVLNSLTSMFGQIFLDEKQQEPYIKSMFQPKLIVVTSDKIIKYTEKEIVASDFCPDLLAVQTMPRNNYMGSSENNFYMLSDDEELDIEFDRQDHTPSSGNYQTNASLYLQRQMNRVQFINRKDLSTGLDFKSELDVVGYRNYIPSPSLFKNSDSTNRGLSISKGNFTSTMASTEQFIKKNQGYLKNIHMSLLEDENCVKLIRSNDLGCLQDVKIIQKYWKYESKIYYT